MRDRPRIATAALLLAGWSLTPGGQSPRAQTEASIPVDLGGDVRLRWESIDADGSDERQRARFRARFGASVAAADNLRVVLRLATGDGNPVSRNLTLDDDFSVRDIVVDRAYVESRPGENLKVLAGKFGLPWFRPGDSQLAWDSDFAPEGLALQVDTGSRFGTVATALVDRPAGDDPWLVTLQGGLRGEWPGGVSWTTGIGYFDFREAAGGRPYYDGDPRGNRVDAAGNYLADFRLLELFAEARASLGGLPVAVYADYLRNTAVDDDGYMLGVRVGSGAEAGDLQVDVGWQRTDPDAVVGLLTWSDLAGGETDSRGGFIKAKYALREKIALGTTLIASRRAVSAGPGEDFDRLMLDVEFWFD